MLVPEAGLVLNICKPRGITSFDVVRKVRGKLGVKKVGHCGTLDPLAEGVLIVLAGKATKRANEFSGLDKTYRAGILLGRETDSYDVTGQVVMAHSTEDIDTFKINEVLKKFHGEIWQVPPMYSAIKIGGRKLYDLARKGVEIEREPRKVVIHNIRMLSFSNPQMEIEVECSKGTYIRSLAHDVGKELGCGGCVESLVRVSVGDFKLGNSIKLNDFLRF